MPGWFSRPAFERMAQGRGIAVSHVQSDIIDTHLSRLQVLYGQITSSPFEKFFVVNQQLLRRM